MGKSDDDIGITKEELVKIEQKITETQNILAYWQKLGKFRAKHPAIGAGSHQQIQANPYVFSRKFSTEDFQDEVIVALHYAEEEKIIDVESIFSENDLLFDAFCCRHDGFVN